MQRLDRKILTLNEFNIRRKRWQRTQKIVFTNGCFDILHRGHVEYLSKAASFGDKLVVGLNSDSSIRRIKGESRPIVCEEDRAVVLSALEMVDYVIIFDEPTPAELIESILPDVLVKGADWAKDEIVGAEIVKANGGEVRRIKLTTGKSTSAIIGKILENNRGER